MLRTLAGIILILPRLAVAAPDPGSVDLTDLSVEQLLNVHVIKASRLGSSVAHAPTSISILTGEDIRTFGWRTLADALNSLRGIFLSNDRNYTYLGIRGFARSGDYNSRVLLMIDGQRMNENVYDGGYIAQEFMLDMELIERIEYVPGSGSSIYGANAFLGMINVITKTGKGIDGALASGQIESFDTYKGRISYGKTLENGADLVFSASHYDRAGVDNLYFPGYDTPETNNGIAQNLDTEKADRLFGKIAYQNWTLSGGYVSRGKQVPTASYDAIFNDPQYFTNDKQFFTNLKYLKALDTNSSVSAKGFFQGYDYYADQPTGTENARVINYDEASGRWFGGEIQLTTTAFDIHKLIAGLEYQYDQRQRLINYDKDPYFSYVAGHRNGHRLELFVQDDIKLDTNWIFSAGLRLDYHHMLKNLQLNPRLGLIWTASDNLSAKLLYSSTFRAPNAWERDYNAFGIIPNPKMHEEQIKSYEATVEWRSNDNLRLLGSLFFNDISNLLQAAPTGDIDGNYAVMNVGKYHAYGAEFESEKRWRNGRLFKASYTYSWLEDHNADETWSNDSPQNLLKLHFAEPLFDDRLRLGIESIFVDQRKTYWGTSARAYELINLNLSSDKLIPKTDISFGVYNVFDSHYEMLGPDQRANVLKMNGREFRLKVETRF